MSKRHGALGVDAYRALGYLPEALRNYLARLGWSQGDREFFTTPELSRLFRSTQVHRSPARFDFAKLENMNGQYMRAMDDLRCWSNSSPLCPICPTARRSAARLDDAKTAQLAKAMPGLKERAKTLIELADGAQFLFAHAPARL